MKIKLTAETSVKELEENYFSEEMEDEHIYWIDGSNLIERICNHLEDVIQDDPEYIPSCIVDYAEFKIRVWDYISARCGEQIGEAIDDAFSDSCTDIKEEKQ